MFRSACRKLHCSSEILDTFSLTDPKTGISGRSPKAMVRVEISPCKFEAFAH